jgi:hypothetical protein
MMYSSLDFITRADIIGTSAIQTKKENSGLTNLTNLERDGAGKPAPSLG